MTIPIFKDRAGQLINRWQDWATPQELYYWTEGRHEMELARSWFTSNSWLEPDTPQCPPELQALFARNTRTANLEIDEGCPEFVTAIPEPGGSQTHDLMLKAHTLIESSVICIAAKADKPFGIKIGDYWRAAKVYEAEVSAEFSGASERIQTLLEIVFGANARPDRQPWCDLSYELLAAVAGTLLQAVNEQVPSAVFVVHEFRTHLAKPEILKANAADYARFVGALFSIPRTSNSQMYGPLRVQSGSHLPQPVDLFVGKATSRIHRRLPWQIAHQMVPEGRSEELFAIILSEYEYLKRKHLDKWCFQSCRRVGGAAVGYMRLAEFCFRQEARELHRKWVVSNRGSDENTRKRLLSVIERDIPDLYPWP